jgi:hypothetical protein
MPSWHNRVSIAVALAAIVALGGTARAAPTFELQHSVDGGSPVTVDLLAISGNTATSATASVNPAVAPGLTITVSTTSDFPGSSTLARLFDTTTDVENDTGSAHTVVIMITETNFTAPTGPGSLVGEFGPVTVRTASGAGTGTATFSDTWAAMDGGNTPFGTTFKTNVYGPATGTITGGGSTTVTNDFPLAYSGNPFSPGTPFSMTLSDTMALDANTSAHLELDGRFRPVPEPSSLVITGMGALGIVGYGLRRRKVRGA